MTILEIINEVQQQLRLPQSLNLDAAHAKLLLSYANEIQRTYMAPGFIWDQLKVYGTMPTVAGTSLYDVQLVNGQELDVIRNLQIPGSDLLIKLTDDDFRAYKTANTGHGQPMAYRIYGKSADGVVTIEVAPTPDAIYNIGWECLRKPARLTLAADVPELDQDTLKLGIKWMVIKGQGRDASGELDAFLARLNGNHGAGEFGDIDFL